jgi:glyoxylase-like metal-dependent hydrolase (beta-lactamase superfamily II)
MQVDFGNVRATVLDAGSLWLDGGAMFGVVPRVLWEREREPDGKNRIHLSMNVLLLEDGRNRVLVDTGTGTKWDEKGREIYRLETRSAEQILMPAGLAPGDIDTVVLTHLHFDHAGGNTHIGASGKPEASFPEATYVVQQGELDVARWDNERTRASYLPENYEPLVEEGRVRTVDGATRLFPWLELRVARGHTPSMQVPVVDAGRRKIAYLADLVPTASHVPYPFIMGYDLEPLETLASKKRILPEAHRDGWCVVFEHDAELPMAVLDEERGRLVARRLTKE